MNIEITIVLLIVAAVAAMILRHNFRHVFLVPEGYAGLLYQHGKFVAQLGVGRNIRWGRGFTLTHQDLRKAILPITGQEVLTAGNVSLKASLSVSYQVVDPVKALHEAQNRAADLQPGPAAPARGRRGTGGRNAGGPAAERGRQPLGSGSAGSCQVRC